ncbi:MAG: hypothetical protein LBI02_01120 [Opitutaceae bacterium]|nr:hypothetical protein [Opitutaceae bacterium]
MCDNLNEKCSNIPVAFVLLFAVFLLPAWPLCAGVEPRGGAPAIKQSPAFVPVKSGADAIWSRMVPPRGAGRPGLPASVDWSQTEALAREFQAKYPDDPRAKEARKIEVTALLKRQGGNAGTPPPDAEARIVRYMADASIPAKDRFDISMMTREVRKDRSKIRSHDDSARSRIEDARGLINEFPDDPRGYGYMLSVAKSSASAIANEASNELIHSSAPEKIKTGARKLLAQRALEGKPMNIRGLDVSAFKGRPVLLYTWSAKRPEMVRAFKYWAVKSGVDMIGVNIDSDKEAARQFAQSEHPPGLLVYDGGGLDGPITSQLRLLMPSSVYLIDRHGVLVDTCGHIGTLGKLAALQKTDGAEKPDARRDGGEK